ncbi:hypothetical protein LEP1GSC188_0816 [Leptospira weilii serovar Topaz str. LT2116]|uniref:Uncharacterized protein n=1 Tax=Leptospira weilii serovar Topaz str. LT2116 TaxID=1088540 RepID=M3FNM3_9LEPT|nr:hypothetical protein LEP1GSC188_0816 [Leptospira weilii serovar Topaz str. LT2116]
MSFYDFQVWGSILNLFFVYKVKDKFMSFRNLQLREFVEKMRKNFLKVRILTLEFVCKIAICSSASQG